MTIVFWCYTRDRSFGASPSRSWDRRLSVVGAWGSAPLMFKTILEGQTKTLRKATWKKKRQFHSKCFQARGDMCSVSRTEWITSFTTCQAQIAEVLQTVSVLPNGRRRNTWTIRQRDQGGQSSLDVSQFGEFFALLDVLDAIFHWENGPNCVDVSLFLEPFLMILN